MIKVTVTLMKADEDMGGVSLSEDACRKAVEKFKEPLDVRFGNTPFYVGKLVAVKYDPEKKEVIGEIDVNVSFAANGRVLQSLDTPAGKRIIECDIATVVMDVQNLKVGRKENEQTDRATGSRPEGKVQ